MMLIDEEENVYKTGMKLDYSPKKIELKDKLEVDEI